MLSHPRPKTLRKNRTSCRVGEQCVSPSYLEGRGRSFALFSTGTQGQSGQYSENPFLVEGKKPGCPGLGLEPPSFLQLATVAHCAQLMSSSRVRQGSHNGDQMAAQLSSEMAGECPWLPFFTLSCLPPISQDPMSHKPGTGHLYTVAVFPSDYASAGSGEAAGAN